jgi:hypothetical protein
MEGKCPMLTFLYHTKGVTLGNRGIAGEFPYSLVRLIVFERLSIIRDIGIAMQHYSVAGQTVALASIPIQVRQSRTLHHSLLCVNHTLEIHQPTKFGAIDHSMHLVLAPILVQMVASGANRMINRFHQRQIALRSRQWPNSK